METPWKRTRSFLKLLTPILFVCTSAFAEQTNQFRGIWASAWQPGFKTKEEITQLISDVRTANLNAVFIQVRKRGDAYYNSAYEPKPEEIKSDFDPLAEVIRQAHDTKAGPRIEVHAWMVLYPVATQMKLKSKTNAPPIIRAASIPKHPYNLHQDWLTESFTGEKFDGQNYAFDPGVPGVQKYLLNVIMNVVTNYDIDGISLDHVRYPHLNFGYNTNAVARFNARFQRTGLPPAEDPDWLQFRRDQVTDFLRKTYLSSISIKPKVKISVCTITSGIAIKDDAHWPQSLAYRYRLQDWRAWMQEGILDINLPMNFLPQRTPFTSEAFIWWNTYLREHRYERHVVVGSALFLNSLPESFMQIRDCLKEPPNHYQADGVCLYAYDSDQSSENTKAEAFAAFSKPSKFDASPAPIFARQMSTPEMPWKTKPDKGHLKGVIINGDKVSLDGARIFLTGPIDRQLHTDATGFYGGVDLPPGNYTLVASYGPYVPSTNQVSISVGKVAQMDILLTNRQKN